MKYRKTMMVNGKSFVYSAAGGEALTVRRRPDTLTRTVSHGGRGRSGGGGNNKGQGASSKEILNLKNQIFPIHFIYTGCRRGKGGTKTQIKVK
jgi:hypothetical protein